MGKDIYYVNLNPISMDNISRTPVNDGQMIEYEIEATDEQYRDLQKLLQEVQAHDLEAADLFTFKHFNEEFSEADRRETQRGLNQVYRLIYELGTPQTKQALEEIHLMDNDE
ncbi:hypothetical protein [Alkalihalobacterium chitinilyticum]|uniref:Hydrolase n=1 Tax=Alkalihalobacterium chitinilyticum TaxID=2980103 RepID=A0ABT5VHE2_9BACI|nr:hypothetical protein [Alkalihalobacterium chitinilyticum]MDE5414865.1 hypothetical protein [Alkalihalobacterium chitinilyticum]